MMHTDLHYQLAEFAHLAKSVEFPERLAHTFVTSLANGMSQSRKEMLYRDIINRLAFEIGLDVDLATLKKCECGCGQEFEVVTRRGRDRQYFNAACRKRAQRKRDIKSLNGRAK